MKKLFLAGDHSVQEFEGAVKTLEQEGFRSALVLSAEGTNFPAVLYDPVLRKAGLLISGGIFPEILFEGKRYKEGTVLIGFNQHMEAVVLYDFEPESIDAQLNAALSNVNPEGQTIFVFIDAFAINKTNVTDALYNCFGTLPNYIGGGAGSLNFDPMPCIFTNQGLIQNGASISIIPLGTSIGVSHGWEVISEPLKVTEAEHNKMKSLEWRPAMEIYQEVIKSHSNQDFDLDNFFVRTQSYAFGISKLGGEMVVRDPFKQEDGAIFTLDNIEQGSHVHILFGNQNSLLQGAKRARDLALQSQEGKEDGEIFIIDCISRVLFMDNDFEKEVNYLDPDKQGFGAFTFGEIANSGECYLEIFNKTAVVCKLDETKY